jgi:poly-gamma-glutamate synthesis protein (capsule biosynthesis protein)
MHIYLLGDVMVGRMVDATISANPGHRVLISPIPQLLKGSAMVLANLETSISDRGHPWPLKTFTFRCLPENMERVMADTEGPKWCWSLANNHAIDYGFQAMQDTKATLHRLGHACMGAGSNRDEALSPAVLDVDGVVVHAFSASDHPVEWAACSGVSGCHTPTVD